MTGILDVPATRRVAAALLRDVVKCLEAETPTRTRTVPQRMAARRWYVDAATDVLFVCSPKVEPWCDTARVDPDIFRAECTRRGFLRDPWADLSPAVQLAIGGRPAVFDDPVAEERFLRFLGSVDRREAA
jgi:hypothetical protein